MQPLATNRFVTPCRMAVLVLERTTPAQALIVAAQRAGTGFRSEPAIGLRRRHPHLIPVAA